MAYSIDIDWHEELRNNIEDWINHGRNAIVNNCKHKDKDNDCNNIEYSGYCEKCEVSEDDSQPMMNYGYPLEFLPNEEEIIKITECGLTIMENEKTGNIYLVLCGGGMDLSQQIGRAYLYAQGWIPAELAVNISQQEGLNISGVEYRKVMKACKESLKDTSRLYRNTIKNLTAHIKKSLQIKRGG